MPQDMFVSRLAEARPDLEPLGEYRGCSVPVKVRSKVCGHTFEAKPDSLYRARTCPVCRKEQTVTDHQSFVKRMREVHPDIKVCGRYINSRTGVELACKKCGFVWDGKPANVLGMQSGCPMCARKLQGAYKGKSSS